MAKKPVKKAAKKSPKKASAAKTAAKKAADQKRKEAAQVKAWLKAIRHPLKKEVEALREIIKNTSDKLQERIKWAAPSYYYKEDIVTFNAWAKDQVHLVFHYKPVEKIKSPLLEGDYDGRRMMYFNSMKEVEAGKKELERILNALLAIQDKEK